TRGLRGGPLHKARGANRYGRSWEMRKRAASVLKTVASGPAVACLSGGNWWRFFVPSRFLARGHVTFRRPSIRRIRSHSLRPPHPPTPLSPPRPPPPHL